MPIINNNIIYNININNKYEWSTFLVSCSIRLDFHGQGILDSELRPTKLLQKITIQNSHLFLARVFPGNDRLPCFLRLRRDLRLMIEFARVSTLAT